MPDIWIDVDTAVHLPVNVLPLIDPTDFKTVEVAIAYNEAGMNLAWNFVTTAGVQTTTAVTPTTAGVHDWVEEGTNEGMYSCEIPASGGTVSNDTEGFGWWSGMTTNCLPFRGPICGFRAAALNNSLVDGTTIDVNTTAVGGTTQTAGDLQALITTVDTVVDGIQTDLDNGTDGLGAIKSDTTAILVDTADMQPKIGTPAADVSADIAAMKVDTEAILVDTGTTLDARIPAALVGGRMDSTIDGTGMETGAMDALLQRQMTESYAADGAAPTVEQALMEILQCLTEFAISGTTITVKKRDGSTTAMTFTLDDGTNPTSRTRAT